MAIIQKQIQLPGGGSAYQTYSDLGKLITDGVNTYSKAIDTTQKTYTETNYYIPDNSITREETTHLIAPLANDSEVVHISEDENISDEKNFSDLKLEGVTVSNQDFSNLSEEGEGRLKSAPLYGGGAFNLMMLA